MVKSTDVTDIFVRRCNIPWLSDFVRYYNENGDAISLRDTPRYLWVTREWWPNLDLSLRPRQHDLTRVVGELGPGDEDDVPDSSGLKSHLFLLAPPPIPFCDGGCDVGAEEDGVGWCGIVSYWTAQEILVRRSNTLLWKASFFPRPFVSEHTPTVINLDTKLTQYYTGLLS